ncbi:hypothetical protein [Muricoccus radiodurans]|uniref:hypothetical protein n=1 Tax=Muricoccus radiodurans TaxID=2231721 RepID=UPI003CE7B1C8
MSGSAVPAWFNRLPAYSRRPGTRLVIVDNQVLSYRLLDGHRDADYDVLFGDPRVVLQIGRMVIKETLRSVGIEDTGMEQDRRGRPVRVGPVIHRPGLPIALHRRMWEEQARLQDQGKLVLVGGFATEQQRILHDRFTALIDAGCNRNMGPKDAHVVAEALVRRIPLFCRDDRARRSFAAGVERGGALAAELHAANLAGFAATMFLP